MTERRFPLLGTGRTISWGTAELAYAEYYRKYGGDQSLGRLADRGGFGENEMDSLYPDWRKREDRVAQLETAMGKAKAMRTALGTLVNRYVSLVNSGDCGDWEPEKEDAVKRVRKAMAEFDEVMP